MSMFLVYDAENYEYILQPAGYVVLVVILIVHFIQQHFFDEKED